MQKKSTKSRPPWFLMTAPSLLGMEWTSWRHFQTKSNHFYCHITTAQVPWWVKFLWACSRQRKKTTTTIYIWTDSAKKTTNNLHMDRQCKKNNKQFTYGQTVQKNCTGAFTVLQTVQKKKNYIWTVHIYRLYRRQCAKYTYIYSVHIVYYKDTLNYQRHIIHCMGTSTLCTVSIHYVVYT